MRLKGFCCVDGCSSKGGHIFPVRPHVKQLWLEALNLPADENTSGRFVCHKHFLLSDYNKFFEPGAFGKTRRLRLKFRAVPSIFKGLSPRRTEPEQDSEVVIEVGGEDNATRSKSQQTTQSSEREEDIEIVEESVEGTEHLSENPTINHEESIDFDDVLQRLSSTGDTTLDLGPSENCLSVSIAPSSASIHNENGDTIQGTCEILEDQDEEEVTLSNESTSTAQAFEECADILDCAKMSEECADILDCGNTSEESAEILDLFKGSKDEINLSGGVQIIDDEGCELSVLRQPTKPHLFSVKPRYVKLTPSNAPSAIIPETVPKLVLCKKGMWAVKNTGSSEQILAGAVRGKKRRNRKVKRGKIRKKKSRDCLSALIPAPPTPSLTKPIHNLEDRGANPDSGKGKFGNQRVMNVRVRRRSPVKNTAAWLSKTSLSHKALLTPGLPVKNVKTAQFPVTSCENATAQCGLKGPTDYDSDHSSTISLSGSSYNTVASDDEPSRDIADFIPNGESVEAGKGTRKRLHSEQPEDCKETEHNKRLYHIGSFGQFTCYIVGSKDKDPRTLDETTAGMCNGDGVECNDEDEPLCNPEAPTDNESSRDIADTFCHEAPVRVAIDEEVKVPPEPPPKDTTGSGNDKELHHVGSFGTFACYVVGKKGVNPSLDRTTSESCDDENDEEYVHKAVPPRKIADMFSNQASVDAATDEETNSSHSKPTKGQALCIDDEVIDLSNDDDYLSILEADSEIVIDHSMVNDQTREPIRDGDHSLGLPSSLKEDEPRVSPSIVGCQRSSGVRQLAMATASVTQDGHGLTMARTQESSSSPLTDSIPKLGSTKGSSSPTAGLVGESHSSQTSQRQATPLAEPSDLQKLPIVSQAIDPPPTFLQLDGWPEGVVLDSQSLLQLWPMTQFRPIKPKLAGVNLRTEVVLDDHPVLQSKPPTQREHIQPKPAGVNPSKKRVLNDHPVLQSEPPTQREHIQTKPAGVNPSKKRVLNDHPVLQSEPPTAHGHIQTKPAGVNRSKKRVLNDHPVLQSEPPTAHGHIQTKPACVNRSKKRVLNDDPVLQSEPQTPTEHIQPKPLLSQPATTPASYQQVIADHTYFQSNPSPPLPPDKKKRNRSSTSPANDPSVLKSALKRKCYVVLERLSPAVLAQIDLGSDTDSCDDEWPVEVDLTVETDSGDDDKKGEEENGKINALPRPSVCYHCNELFPSEDLVEGHILETHSGKEYFVCPECDVEFPSAIDCNRHLGEKHVKKDDSAIYLCPQCDFTTTDNVELRGHLDGQHRSQKQLSCPHCAFNCFSKKDFQLHVNRHSRHSNVGFGDVIEEKTFKKIRTDLPFYNVWPGWSEDDSKKELKVLPPELPLNNAPTGLRDMNSKKCLKTLKPVACTVRTPPLRPSLECPLCPESFPTNFHRENHMQKQHRENLMQKPRDCMECTMCNVKNLSADAFLNHLSARHIVCPLCKQGFPREGIQKHFLEHKCPSKLHTCHVCPFTTTVDKVVVLHKMIAHKMQPFLTGRKRLVCPVCIPHSLPYDSMMDLSVHCLSQHKRIYNYLSTNPFSSMDTSLAEYLLNES